MSPLGDLRAAASFLTRIPLRARLEEPARLGRSVPYFPVVGAFVGALVAAVYAVALLGLPSLPAAALAVAAGIALTGALHEDGIGDLADALGGRDQVEALRILKDPHQGTFGVIAICLSVVLRITSLAALDEWCALAVMVGAHALSRAATVRVMGTGPSITDRGLGASHASSVGRRQVMWGAAGGLAIAAVSMGAWAVAAASLAAAGAGGVAKVSARRLGGVSGDVLGAAEQVGEILVLLMAAAVTARGWMCPAWWAP